MNTTKLAAALACTFVLGCAVGSSDAPPLEENEGGTPVAPRADQADAGSPSAKAKDSGAAPAEDAGTPLPDAAVGAVDDTAVGAVADTAVSTKPDAGGSTKHDAAVSDNAVAPVADSGTGTVADASTAGATYVKHELTFYGYPDNSPPGAGIALPKIHSKAGGVGTYADPVTFATAPSEFAAGTILYVPMLQKYVIMEDTCAACTSDWSAGKRHIDVWMNSDSTNTAKLLSCQYSWTRPSVDVEISPPPGRPVSTVPLFDPATGVCQPAP